jgi:hypothetical protein
MSYILQNDPEDSEYVTTINILTLVGLYSGYAVSKPISIAKEKVKASIISE